MARDCLLAAQPGREYLGPTPSPDSAVSRWRRDLESWAIPEPILRAAPESPWGYSPRTFARRASASLESTDETPSRGRALEVLPAGGSVLDVGCGGGAASLPLAPPAGLVLAVDESPAMLAAFVEAAGGHNVEHQEIEGRWPDVARMTPTADVVVCHHVVYNVANIAPFVVALSEHARNRVVLELTRRHPLSNLSPLWLSIHGVERPTAPTSEDAAEVVRSLGYDAHEERFERPSPWATDLVDERLALARRQLCVGPEHDEEIAAYLESDAANDPRQITTLWWDVPAPT